MVIKEPWGIGNSPQRNHDSTPYAGYCRDTGNPFAPNYQGADNSLSDYYDDMDNPFRAVPTDATPAMLSKACCSFVAGVPREDYQSFLRLASKAFYGAQPYYQANYFDGILVAYQGISWTDNDENIKKLIEYLRALGNLDTPVAYARLGDGIEAYANLAGYGAYTDKITWNPILHKMDFEPDYNVYADI